jgi:hypothetical protein
LKQNEIKAHPNKNTGDCWLKQNEIKAHSNKNTGDC